MANLTETATWTAGVYQIETSDPVLGGPSGISNQQAKDLANRTAYLKEQLESNLDMDAAAAGVLGVKFGGTGRDTLTAGSYLTGDGTGGVVLKTAAEVMADLKVIPYFTSVPSTNVAPVVHVVGLGELWWTETAYFTGYRSPKCGRLEYGWTPSPLPFQVSAVGGTWTTAAHAGLIARFQESGLVVPLASWKAGEYMIADMGSGNWKAPDMRDMFLRFTGTDADTANARLLGSKQLDDYKSHNHPILQSVGAQSGTPQQVINTSGAITGGATSNSGGAETRSVNMALNPVIIL